MLLRLIWLLLCIVATFAVHAQGTLAYISGGDVWVKALPNGQARRLASGGFVAPRWAVSGRWLAYRRGSAYHPTLFVAHRASGGIKAVNGGAPIGRYAWSPAADTLAYTTLDGTLRLLSAGSWRERVLVRGIPGTEDHGVVSFTWSADGRQLAYEYDESPAPAGEGQPPNLRASLWHIGSDGRGQQRLLIGTSATFRPIAAGWARTGRQILYWQNAGFSASLLADGVPLAAVPTGGGRSRVLSAAMLAYPDFLAVSPTLNLLAVAEGQSRESWTRKRIAVIDPASGARRVLTSPRVAAFSPAWSPDGRQLAFVAGPDIGPAGGGTSAQAALMQRRVRLMARNGAAQRALIATRGYRDEYPRWSADGRSLLIVRVDATDQAGAWVIRADGRQPRLVAANLGPPASTAAPRWLGVYGYVDWGTYLDWYTR